jgi:hypothetical protein
VKASRAKPQPDIKEQARLWLEREMAEGRLKPVTDEQLARVAQIILGAARRPL